MDLCEENINFKCSSWDLTIIDIIIDITIDIVACYTLSSYKADKDNQQNSKRKLLLITTVPSNIIFLLFGSKQHSGSFNIYSWHRIFEAE